MKILIIGHFGGRNIGDEIILLSQMQLFTKKFGECEFIIYSYDKEHTINTYRKYGYKIKTIEAFGLRKTFSSITDQIKNIKEIDFAILGGGGIMQDTYFSYGIFRYLLPIYICAFKGIPFYSYAMGVNRFNHKSNEILFDNIMKYSNGISVRDNGSEKNIHNFNPSLEISKILDSALSFDTKLLNTNQNNDNLTIVIREFFEPYLNKISFIAQELNKKYNFKEINIIVFENNSNENNLAKNLKSLLNNELKVSITNDINPLAYLNLLNNSNIVLTGRLHGLLPAALLNKTLICMSYAPKIESYCKRTNIPYLKFEDLKNIKNINLESYTCDSSKIEVIDKEYLEETQKFIDTINDKKHIKINLKPLKKISLFLQLTFFGMILLSKHIFNKILNKSPEKE